MTQSRWLTSRPAILASAVLMLTLGLATAPAQTQNPLPDAVTVDAPFAGSPAYEENFHEDKGGWEAHTPPAPAMTWEHGTPTSGPSDHEPDQNVWATNLDGDYRPYECGVLLSPPIDLQDATEATLTIEHAYAFYHTTTRAHDVGVFLISTDDAGTFEQVTPQEGYDAQAGFSARSCLDLDQHAMAFTGHQKTYTSSTLDLAPYTGETVRFALGFASGSSSDVREGWYVNQYALDVDGDETSEAFDDPAGFTIEAFEDPDQPGGWDWGTPSTGTGPSFDEPTRLWGTNLDDDHRPNECSTITSPPIDLTGIEELAPQASLQWDQWYRSSVASAGGVVQIGVDGEYANVEPRHGYPGSPHQALDECLNHETQATGAFAGSLQSRGDDMEPTRADITDHLGQEITIRFVFGSTDGIFLVDGWYIDDVRIELGAGLDPVTVPLPDPTDNEAYAFQPVSTVYEEDFTDDDGDWSVAGTPTWEWGIPVTPPTIPPGSMSMWGTNLLGDTSDGQCSYLESPPIALPPVDAAAGVETAQLTLDTYQDLASNEDGAIVMAKGDAGHWHVLEPHDGYDDVMHWWSPIICMGIPVNQAAWTGPAEGIDDWSEDSFDLSPFMGEEVQLRIAYSSSFDDEHRGVYLDQATIELGVGAHADASLVNDPTQALDDACQDNVPGWDVQRPSATWCKSLPTTGPSTVQPVWATDPHGLFTLGECSYLVTDPIDTDNIPGLGPLELTVEHFINSGFRTGGQVQVSDDGGETWRAITPTGGYTATERNSLVTGCLSDGADQVSVFRSSSMDTYEEETFNLRGYTGDTIQLRFAFAGMNTPDLGWYVKNAEMNRGLNSVPVTLLANTPSTSQEAPARQPAVTDQLLEKAGPGLSTALLEDDAIEFPVILTGPSHEDAPRFASRDDALAYYEDNAEPFVRSVENVLGMHGGTVEDVWPAVPALQVTASMAALEALAGLDETHHVAYDEPGSVELVHPLPPDEGEVRLFNTDGRQMLQAEDAWEEGFQGQGVTISVIDTGIDGSHEAFKTQDGDSRIVGWLDLYSGLDAPYDDHGHGTHVAASAAGSSVYEDPEHGAFQETGVAPQADLLGVKFLSGGGSGSLSDALDALEWSFENDADLTSNSWGTNCGAALSIIAMVQELTQQGMLSVFAAGNSGPSSGTIGGPACGEDSVTVGATDADGDIASFSSRGPCTDPVKDDAEERICPDVVAKGHNVRSAVPRDSAAGADPSGYATWSGTSMATPQVAGALALIEEMKIDRTGAGWDTASGADKHILEATSLPLPTYDAEPSNDYGEGMPQVMSVYHVLQADDEARIVDSFSIGDEEIRIGDRTEHRFTVQNHGNVPAEGAFNVSLTLPDGSVETLKETTGTLGFLDMEAYIETFQVEGDTLPGEYTLEATYDYAWEDPETGDVIEETVEHAASFEVVRPYLDIEMEGLDAEALPGEVQPVTFAVENTGNEAATGLELRLTVPAEYEFVPPDDADLMEPNERYANPPPEQIHDDGDQVTLVFEPDPLDVGSSTAYELSVAGTVPDDYRFLALAVFTDAAGNGFAQGATETQTIQGPASLVPFPEG